MKHEIERVTRYRFDGREFCDLPAVLKYVVDEIGNVIDSTPNRLKPADALAIHNALVKHRDRLCLLLSASFDPQDDNDGLHGSKRSIFKL